MDPVILLIWLTFTAAAGLLVFHVAHRLMLPRQLMRERLAAVAVEQNSESNAFIQQQYNLPLVGDVLPMFREATQRMAVELEQADWKIQVGQYLAWRMACAAIGTITGLVVFTIVSLGPGWIQAIVMLGLTVGGWMLPRQFLQRKRKRRLELIEKELPAAITTMAKSLRAGMGLFQALGYAANHTKPPLGLELQRTVQELQLGGEVREIFTGLVRRTGSADIDIMATAIIIQRTVGGNLAEILFTVTNTIRERADIKAEVQVLTSKQRMTANMVALLPVLVAAAFIGINPDMGMVLLTTVPGRIALAVGIFFELAGFFIIRRLSIIQV